MATVTIKNIDRLIQRLNRIADMELEEKMKEAVTTVHGQAVELAVFEKGYSKGQLRESISMEINKKDEALEGRVYTNVQHAPYVEFGTGIRGNGSYPYDIDGLKLTYNEEWAGMEAQPFMYPALKMHEKYIKQLFKDGVKDNLAKNCKGG